MSPASGDGAGAIRVLVVDDQALFREGVVTLLSAHGDVEVVGEAENGRQALEMVARLRPAVVLMDLRMPVLDGVSATREIVQRHPGCRVIVLTTFDDDDEVFDALRAGAAGYLLKDVSSEKLAEAIRVAARGESFLQPSIASKVLAELNRRPARPTRADRALLEPLSERELEVLRHLARGASNREIAARVYLAEGTVKNYVSSILGKLGAPDRTAAALRARDLGIL
ncbi:MAG TPA: response regulator transcription factor [Thermoanaerobaculia bacterium]|nr:response regulator transcription factor [Thermoanaerobaculia bacterium]